MDDLRLPLGFRYAGVCCGIKQAKDALDIALFCADDNAVAAGVYTQNRVRAASVLRNEQLTPSEQIRAVMITSGNANACTGTRGETDNQTMADQLADRLGCQANQCLVLSTGIIGEFLPMEKLQTGIGNAAEALSHSNEAFHRASLGMLTTDNGPKVVNRVVRIGEQEVRIAGAAKGGGMIGPNMATMHAVVMTDAVLEREAASRLLSDVTEVSFNAISVEGHTSTSDTSLLVASGKAGTSPLHGDDLATFFNAYREASIELAKLIPSDGEGSSHLITINVSGANSISDARRVAKTIAHSALVKTAVTGADPNWGRIVSAAGYADVEFDPSELSLSINGQAIFAAGQPLSFDEAALSQSMSENFETILDVQIGTGSIATTFWTSDLTCDYVKLNSEYHT